MHLLFAAPSGRGDEDDHCGDADDRAQTDHAGRIEHELFPFGVIAEAELVELGDGFRSFFC